MPTYKNDVERLAALKTNTSPSTDFLLDSKNTGAALAKELAPRRFLSTLTSAQRKEYPLVTGVIDYFPDALTMVSHVSYLGNQKHNPGQPLHWARGKSSDHLDCIGRHLIERDVIETDNIRHLANQAWRTLAELQVVLEHEYNLSLPRGATPSGVELK